jgi:hypothetical protein
MALKNSVRTAKKTHHFTITKINRLKLFKEIIAVYSQNYMKIIQPVCKTQSYMLLKQMARVVQFYEKILSSAL